MSSSPLLFFRRMENRVLKSIEFSGLTETEQQKMSERQRILCEPLFQTPPTPFQATSSCFLLIIFIIYSFQKDLRRISDCQMIYNYHLLFKYIIVGDPSVGKSSLLLRFIDNKFTQNYESTLGVQFGSKIFTLGSTVVKTMIWDTAGQESFKSIIRSYYKNSIVALLVFDITNQQSFENLQKWLDEIKNNANEYIRVVLVGNKADLFERRAVRREVAQEFANSLGMGYYQTSAKSGSSVGQVFTEPARQLITDIEEKRLLVSSVTESMGIKIGNPQLRSSQKAFIQISIQSPQKQGCKC